MTVRFPTKLNTHDPVIDERAKMLERFIQVFGKVNSVLTLRPIKVKVTKSNELPAPAWSDADSVTFNAVGIGDLTDVRDLAWLKGLDFHEIAHILYTPRAGSELVQWVKDNGLWQAFNGLEDMRIETLLTGRYPSIVPWLQATVARYFLDKPENFQYSYALLRGRKYLEVEIRRASREAWYDQSTVAELIEVVDAYRELVFPNDYEVAKDLIKRYSELLPNQTGDGDGQTECGGRPMPANGDGNGEGDGDGQPIKVKKIIIDPFGHGGRPTEVISSSTSRPASAKEQRNDKKSSQRFELDEDVEIEVLDKPQGDSQPSNEGDPSDDKDSDSNQSETPSEDSSDESDESDKSANDKTAGNSVQDLLKNALDELFDDEKVSLELENLVRQIQGLPTLNSTNGGNLKQSDFNNVPVSPDTHMVARAFARELERIKASVDPAWESQESAGRLSAIRYERGDDYKTIFDRWSEGRADVTDIECVIALDVSASMNSNSKDAYEAMYALKRGLDRIEASTSVVLFESSSRVLYKSTDKAGTHMRDAGVGGGTDPIESIRFANNIFAESKRAIKMFFIITDGEWYDSTDSDELIAKMRKAGVLTSFAFIGYGQPASVHNCEVAHAVSSAKELIPLGKKLVRLAISRQLTK